MIHTSCFCLLHRWEIRLLPKVLKCFTINIKNSRCSQWESKLFAILSFSLFATPLCLFIDFKPHPFPVPFDPITSTLTQVSIRFFSHKPEQKVSETEGTSDEEEVGGDFTVYECPGLAPVSKCMHKVAHTHIYSTDHF